MTTVLDVKKRLSAVWHKESDKSETYEFDLAGDTAWGCMRRNGSGASRFKQNYDAKTERLWWGQSYFLDAADLVAKPNKVVWFRASDPNKKKGAFTWLKLRDVPLQVQTKVQPKAYDKSTPFRPQERPSPTTRVVARGDALPSLPAKAKPSTASKMPGDSRPTNASSAGAVVSHGRAGRPAPEMILDLKHSCVIYKPPFWKCELPEKDPISQKRVQDLLVLNWVRDKIKDIDEKLFEEDFNQAISGTGFGPLAHRIDAETSGNLLICKTVEAQRHIKAQFHKTKVGKRYVCLVHGVVKAREGVIDASIRTVRTDQTTRSEVASTGEWAETKYQVIATYRSAHRDRQHASVAPGYSLVACDITTGRTHQIRVHMLHLGHALVSDSKYLTLDGLTEDRTWCPRLFLHSYRLCFKDMSNEDVLVTCPLPDDLRQAVMTLGASDLEMEDCLFDDTSWQRELLRPSRLQWRPGTGLQRKLAEILGKESGPVRLNDLNGMPELREIMTEESVSGIGKPWLMKHWEVFEIIPEPSTGDICVRLRAELGDDEVQGIDLDRQIESVQSEIESLQQQKQRAIAQEEYQQAAEIKRRTEGVNQQLQSLVALRLQYLQDQNDENAEGGLDRDEQAKAEAQARRRRKAEEFVQDVRDESLFPSLGGTPQTSSAQRPSLGLKSSGRAGSTSREASVDSRAPARATSVDSRVSADESLVQVDLKDALYEYLLKREGYVASMNEINNDKYMRQVMRVQQPKAVSAVTKGWLNFYEGTFVILRSSEQEMYVALDHKVRPKSAGKSALDKLRDNKQSNEKVAPAYHQVVQKMPGSDAPPLVYEYSAVAQKEESSKDGAKVDGTSDWKDLFLAALSKSPKRSCTIDELLEAVPQFAKSMGARKLNEQRNLLLMFLQSSGDKFVVKKEGFGSDQKVVYAK